MNLEAAFRSIRSMRMTSRVMPPAARPDRSRPWRPVWIINRFNHIRNRPAESSTSIHTQNQTRPVRRNALQTSSAALLAPPVLAIAVETRPDCPGQHISRPSNLSWLASATRSGAADGRRPGSRPSHTNLPGDRDRNPHRPGRHRDRLALHIQPRDRIEGLSRVQVRAVTRGTGGSVYTEGRRGTP